MQVVATAQGQCSIWQEITSQERLWVAFFLVNKRNVATPESQLCFFSCRTLAEGQLCVHVVDLAFFAAGPFFFGEKQGLDWSCWMSKTSLPPLVSVSHSTSRQLHTRQQSTNSTRRMVHTGGGTRLQAHQLQAGAPTSCVDQSVLLKHTRHRLALVSWPTTMLIALYWSASVSHAVGTRPTANHASALSSTPNVPLKKALGRQQVLLQVQLRVSRTLCVISIATELILGMNVHITRLHSGLLDSCPTTTLPNVFFQICPLLLRSFLEKKNW